MNIYSEFQEVYFKENINISINIGNAICKNNLVEVKNIIDKYFSTDETKIFLEGTIAYQSKENGGGKDGSLLSPGFLAFERANRNTLELIVRACGNPDLSINPDGTGFTVLMAAAEKGDRETVELLISLGANPNFIYTADNGVCISALGKAIFGGFQKTAELLISHGAHFTISEAMAAVEVGKQFPPFVEELIRQNPEIFSQTGFNDRRTLLHHAAAQGKERIVRWLVENGVDINAPDAENRTPLWYANVSDQNSVAEYLKSKGATSGVSGYSADQGNQNSNIEPSKPEELTHLVERLELIEDKLCVRFEGIYCVQIERTWENPVDFVVEVNFDVIGTDDNLSKSFSPTFSAYNASGQLISTNTSFIHNERFLGIESLKIQLTCYEAPTRFRLYPANPI